MKTVFKNFKLIDGTGAPVNENVSMLVENGKIVEIGANVSGTDCETVDLGGKYVMPGLIDCHVHSCISDINRMAAQQENEVDCTVNTIVNLGNLLKNGVTYIRDTGHYKHVDLKLRRHLQSGTIKGPGMICSGECVVMTGGHAHFMSVEADGVDEVRKAVRAQIKAGVDGIKVCATGGVATPGMSVHSYQHNVEELAVAVEEAHKVGKKVLSHAHGTQGIKNSIIAGVDSVEHASILDDEAIEMAVKAGTYFVPTLAVLRNIIDSGVAMGLPPHMLMKAQEVEKTHTSGIKKAYDAGVKLAMGTDTASTQLFGSNSHYELELMAGIGIPNMEVIKISTKNAADLLGIAATHGTLEVGKAADFIVMPENPVENISAVRELQSVYQAGIKV